MSFHYSALDILSPHPLYSLSLLLLLLFFELPFAVYIFSRLCSYNFPVRILFHSFVDTFKNTDGLYFLLNSFLK